MLRRLSSLCFALLLVLTSVSADPIFRASAQDGSPVAVDTDSDDLDASENPSLAPVQAAEENGNTPQGISSSTAVFALDPSVYLYFNQVTASGNSVAGEGSVDGLGAFVPAYRTDNARRFDIETSATYTPNITVCIYYGPGQFSASAFVDLFRFDGTNWIVITGWREAATVCGYTAVLGTFVVAEPGANPEPSASLTPLPTDTSTATATDTIVPTATSSATTSPTFTATPTSATGQTQFALDNVWVTYSVPPASGTTWGSVLDGSAQPALPFQYQVANAWFFSIETSVTLTTGKEVCVLFDATRFVHPSTATLLHSTGTTWAPLSNPRFTNLDDTQGTLCGYTNQLGAFVLAEKLPLTATPALSPSRTATATSTPSKTATARPTWTPTPATTPTSSATSTPSHTSVATQTPTASPSATATATSTSTSTLTPSATNTLSPASTPTLGPGSYATGTTLRTTTRVNLRGGPGTGATTLGVVNGGTLVQATGPSASSGGHVWVPVTVTGLGMGWIAGDYLKAASTPTPTRTTVPPAATRTPGSGIPSSTPTRTAGGLVAGDYVKTTTSLNLRSAPGTNGQVLAVIPSKSIGRVTGLAVSSGGLLFYPVQFDGKPGGYVAGKYLQRVTSTPTATRTVSPTATIAGVPTRWTTSTVNMRSGAGSGYRIVATLPEGTRISVTGNPKRSGGYDWYPVVVQGIGPGWIAGKFLTAIPPL